MKSLVTKGRIIKRCPLLYEVLMRLHGLIYRKEYALLKTCIEGHLR